MDSGLSSSEGGLEVGVSCSGFVELEGEVVDLVAEVIDLLLEPNYHLLKRRNLRLSSSQRSLQ